MLIQNAAFFEEELAVNSQEGTSCGRAEPHVRGFDLVCGDIAAYLSGCVCVCVWVVSHVM